MNHQGQPGANEIPASQCSNPTCQATFTSPVQHCLTCGALLKGALLSGRFRVEALLGHGGMGAVYRATDLTLERAVALKVLAPSAGLAGDAPEDLRARFFREARLAAQLDHPHIVPVLHFDIDGPLAYLVMPWLTGGTLGNRLHPGQPADPVTVASWLHQMAAALDFAHQRPQPIIHRDVKPGNLLFHEDGRLCLADFGIARVAAGAQSGMAAHLTRTGMLLGSLAYMAPEQIDGRAVPASDQYSTGVLLYQALTGALPFDAAENYGLMIQHASATPPPPSEHVPGLPGRVDAVVLRALAKQPEERFPTVGSLAEAFEAVLTSAPTAPFARSPSRRATLPNALRPDFRPEQQGLNEALADDWRGERPTEAATRLRSPPGRAPAGAPQRPPSAPDHRNWWIPTLLTGLAVILLCVVALAGLSALSQANRTSGSQTTTSASPSLTPTQTDAQHYEVLLAAAESNGIQYQDTLTTRKQWNVTTPARFDVDGLHLPTHQLPSGQLSNQTVLATNDHMAISLAAIEVQVRFTGATVDYGFFFPTKKDPSLALVLNTGGAYGVAPFYRSSSRNVIFGLTPAPHLTLTPGSTSYHLEVLVQSTQFVLFLERHFLAIVPFSPAFPTSTTFAFFSYSPEGALAADVVFSNLAIYPAS